MNENKDKHLDGLAPAEDGGPAPLEYKASPWVDSRITKREGKPDCGTCAGYGWLTIRERAYRCLECNAAPVLRIIPGESTPEDSANLLASLAALYRSQGGRGLKFTVTPDDSDIGKGNDKTLGEILEEMGANTPEAKHPGPCDCPLCKISRRRQEIEKAPTVEAYAALLDDVTTLWMYESLDMGMDIYHRDQEIEALRARLGSLEGRA